MTLVLIHSSCAAPPLWDRVRENLTGIPVLAPALPGRASNPWPPDDGDRSVAAYARAVLAAMDREGIGAATIAGHSLGGAIALQIALEHPDRVLGLGLVCTGARLRVWPHALDALAEGVREAIDVMVAAWCGPRTNDRERIAIRRLMESVGTEQGHLDLCACDAFDVMDRLGEIRARTQVI
ncbi:MAG: alpha/beta fold hydrolase, partial [Steroidobacteraceae bacterium]